MKYPAIIALSVIFLAVSCAKQSTEISAPSDPMATDWPNWMGVHRDNVSQETDWSPGKLDPNAVAWTAEVGKGYSSVAIAGTRLYTAGATSEAESIHCLDAVSGKFIWSLRLPVKRFLNDGPQSTPTVENDRLYFFSAGGFAFCVNCTDHSIVWQRDLVTDLKLQVPRWAFAGSARVYGNYVLLNAGGGGVALDKNTGKTLWANPEGEAGYTTPVVFHAGGMTCAAVASIEAVVFVELANGKILWTFPWTAVLHDYPADPLILGNRVLISTACQEGAAFIDFSGFNHREVWIDHQIVSNIANYVYEDGIIYGNSNPRYNPGDRDSEFFCMDVAAGKKLWTLSAPLGTAIAAGGYLIRLDCRGQVTIGARNTSGFQAIAQARILQGYCITPPVFSAGRLYCRSLQGKLVCVDLRN